MNTTSDMKQMCHWFYEIVKIVIEIIFIHYQMFITTASMQSIVV